MEIKIVLAMLLQRYRLALVPGERLNYHASAVLTIDRAMPMVASKEQKQTPRATPFKGTVHDLVRLPQ